MGTDSTRRVKFSLSNLLLLSLFFYFGSEITHTTLALEDFAIICRKYASLLPLSERIPLVTETKDLACDLKFLGITWKSIFEYMKLASTLLDKMEEEPSLSPFFVTSHTSYYILPDKYSLLNAQAACSSANLQMVEPERTDQCLKILSMRIPT